LIVDARLVAQKSGALYVLKGDLFLRIKVKGPESDESRLEKSQALAAKAPANL
jgi:hypothetical protein